MTQTWPASPFAMASVVADGSSKLRCVFMLVGNCNVVEQHDVARVFGHVALHWDAHAWPFGCCGCALVARLEARPHCVLRALFGLQVGYEKLGVPCRDVENSPGSGSHRVCCFVWT